MNELKASLLSGNKCPYCKSAMEFPAISRLDDETKICGLCGQTEVRSCKHRKGTI